MNEWDIEIRRIVWRRRRRLAFRLCVFGYFAGATACIAWLVWGWL